MKKILRFGFIFSYLNYFQLNVEYPNKISLILNTVHCVAGIVLICRYHHYHLIDCRHSRAARVSNNLVGTSFLWWA